jgi:phage tail-like protein
MPPLGLNAVGLGTNMLGRRADPYQGFNFLIEIEGLLVGGFSECTGLTVETEFYDYREGGENGFVHRLPGPTKYPPLVLKHGLTEIDGLWTWHQDVVQWKVERRNGTIYLLNRQGLPVIWWDFEKAYPTKYSGPDFRADSGAVAFESVELAHRGLSRPSVAGLVDGVAAALSGALDPGF